MKDAFLNEDLLIIAHSNRLFRFYSLEWIMKNCTVIEPKLGGVVQGSSGLGELGSRDIGIPVTVKITGSDYSQSFVCQFSHCSTPT